MAASNKVNTLAPKSSPIMPPTSAEIIVEVFLENLLEKLKNVRKIVRITFRNENEIRFESLHLKSSKNRRQESGLLYPRTYPQKILLLSRCFP